MKANEREQARELRRQGWSIKDIQKELRVSRSSVSVWVRDIALTQSQIDSLNFKQETTRRFGCRAVYDAAKKRHENNISLGVERASQDEGFRLLSAIYWGEGNKTQRTFGLSNADSSMILFLVDWFDAHGMLDRVSVSVVHHEENGVPDDEVRDWWLRQLPSITEVKVRRSKISRASQKKNIGKLPYGTARLDLKRSTDFFFQVMGGIEFLKTRAVSSVGQSASFTPRMP